MSMKFLIDGSSNRIKKRREQANELIGGQLLTPLTQYKLCEPVFAVDNGAFSKLNIAGLTRILKRYYDSRKSCLFVAIPDKVGDHKETVALWEKYSGIADGYKKAFVAQDGFEGFPCNAEALFVGGTDSFKDSKEADNIVAIARMLGMHTHVGRVNTPKRFNHFHNIGVDTCDGSGVSMYDHMIEKIILDRNI